MKFRETAVNDKIFKETWIDEIESKFPSSSYEYLTFGNTHTSEKDYFLIATNKTNKPIAIAYLSTLTHNILGIFKLKVLTLGNQMTNGMTFWFDSNIYTYKDFLKSLTIYIKKNIKCQIILLKDFKEGTNNNLINVNKELGFFNFNTFSRAYKFLEPTFEEYLASLNSKKRRFLKKEVIKTYEQNNLIIKNINRVSDEELRYLYQLYKDVSLNAKEIKIKAFPYNFFERINTHFNNINYTIVYENQKIIGFGLLLSHQEVVRCFCLGLDYEYVRKNNLWYVIVINAITYSIDNGYKKIEFGNSNYAMKKKFGGIEEKIIFGIRLKNDSLNRLMFPLLKIMINNTFKTNNND